MSDKPEVLVRMFYRDADDDLDSDREDYTVEQYGGTIPNVGDIVVSQGMNSLDANRLDPEERTFCEVVRRYFLPDDKLVRVVLEVKPRSGKWGEREEGATKRRNQEGGEHHETAARNEHPGR